MLFRFKRHDAVIDRLLYLPHVTAVALKAVCLGSNATKTCISIGVIFKQIPPSHHWKLGGYKSGLSRISGFDDFKQITASVQAEIHKSEIITITEPFALAEKEVKLLAEFLAIISDKREIEEMKMYVMGCRDAYRLLRGMNIIE